MENFYTHTQVVYLIVTCTGFYGKEKLAVWAKTNIIGVQQTKITLNNILRGHAIFWWAGSDIVHTVQLLSLCWLEVEVFKCCNYIELCILYMHFRHFWLVISHLTKTFSFIMVSTFVISYLCDLFSERMPCVSQKPSLAQKTLWQANTGSEITFVWQGVHWHLNFKEWLAFSCSWWQKKVFLYLCVKYTLITFEALNIHLCVSLTTLGWCFSFFVIVGGTCF